MNVKLNYLKSAELLNLRLSETIRTSIIALNMVQLTPEQRKFVIKTFYEISPLQQTRSAFGLIKVTEHL
jgi:ribosome recycling factor